MVMRGPSIETVSCGLDYTAFPLQVMTAVVTIHNWYIYLGDLSRYGQQCLPEGPDWSKPRRYANWQEFILFSDLFAPLCLFYTLIPQASISPFSQSTLVSPIPPFCTFLQVLPEGSAARPQGWEAIQPAGRPVHKHGRSLAN